MVKKLVVKTGNSRTLFDMLHELGSCFVSQVDKDVYRVVYFATNREVWFEGPLTAEQIEQLKGKATFVRRISLDELDDEIVIEE